MVYCKLFGYYPKQKRGSTPNKWGGLYLFAPTVNDKDVFHIFSLLQVMLIQISCPNVTSAIQIPVVMVLFVSLCQTGILNVNALLVSMGKLALK